MSYKISGTEVINDSRKGIFTSANVGSFTPSNRPTSGISAGDVIFNSTLGILEVYDGSTWLNASGGFGDTPYASGGQVYHRSEGSSGTANYYYHIFSTTGIFTCHQDLDYVSIALIGGGGGGGNTTGGGGGGGAIVSTVNRPLVAGSYTISIGAGGAAASTGAGISGTGGSTKFGANNFTYYMVASGGGAGGSASFDGGAGANGGGGGGNIVVPEAWVPSGGSGSSTTGIYQPSTGSQNTTKAGYNGGKGYTLAGGGGAGAGGAGGDAPTNSQAGNGSQFPAGYGAAGSYVPWDPAGSPAGKVAAGGGGGRNGGARPPNWATGGFGGGGQGKSPNATVYDNGNGNYASGSGGGGGAQAGPLNHKGGNGGSGLVMIRYYTGGNQPNTQF